MSLTQILAWLSGPGVGVALSYILDQWQPWHDWKPNDILGFNPKAAIITIGSLLLGVLAYVVATTVPETTISTIDPYVKAAFPLLTLIIPQIWHATINRNLGKTTITASSSEPATLSATVTAQSGNVTANNNNAPATSYGGSSSPGQGA